MLRAICQTDDINFHIRYVINFNVIAYAKVDAIELQKVYKIFRVRIRDLNS